MSEIEPRCEHELPDPADHPFVNAVLRLVPRGDVALHLWQDLYDRGQRRAETMLGAASQSAGNQLDEVVERLVQDERVTDLLRAAVEAAARSGLEAKLRALGRALVNGALAADDAEIDLADLMVRTLDDLGAAEIRALDQLARSPSFPNILERTSALRLAIQLPDEAAVAVQASLQRHGLVFDAGGGTWDSLEGKFNWRPSAYGIALLQLLRDAADDSGE